MADYTVELSELETLLQGLPNNTIDNPYSIKITDLGFVNITSFREILTNNNYINKFVDLRESSLNTSGIDPESYQLWNMFNNLKTMVYAPDISSFILVKMDSPVRGMFDSCSSLKEMPVIPNGIENIEGWFLGCQKLTNVKNIPNSVTNMTLCFNGCISLITAPVIPNSVTNMGGCFEDCISLTEAPIIPNSVTDMSTCFKRCISLTEVSILVPSGNLNTISCFNNTTQSISVKTQNKNALEAKLSDVFPNNVTIQQELNWEVPFNNLDGFLSGCLQSPSSVYRLNVTGLQESDIGDSYLEGTLGYIIRNNNGVYADYSDTILPEVIDMRYCFAECTSLTTAPIIPNSVTDMSFCFAYCTNITTIDNFQADTENCDMTNCFAGCPNLSYIGVPETLPNATKWQFVHAVEDNDGITMTIETDDTEPVEVETSEHTYGILGLICDMLFSEDAFDSTRMDNYLASRMPWIVESPTSLDANEDWTVIWAKDPTKVKSNIIPTVDSFLTVMTIDTNTTIQNFETDVRVIVESDVTVTLGTTGVRKGIIVTVVPVGTSAKVSFGGNTYTLTSNITEEFIYTGTTWLNKTYAVWA